MTVIEDVLLDSPQKAIRLPLLQDQVKDLERNIADRLEAAQAQIDDADEDTKWIIGVLGLGLASIGVPVVANTLKRGRDSDNTS